MSFSFCFTTMHYFVLVYQIKSSHKTVKFVVANVTDPVSLTNSCWFTKLLSQASRRKKMSFIMFVNSE